MMLFLLQAMAAPELTVDMLVVFGIIGVTFVLFVTEVIPLDITAIAVVVALILLEPWTQISPQEGILGFANPATITVMAMFPLSEGIRRSGLIQLIGQFIVRHTGGSLSKQFAAITGFSGGVAGFINNTPVVAIMIPMVNDIARRTGTSPSKLLMPVSFTAMMGGMLTLIGTSTNLLASDVSARIIGRPFSMFEFTQLGLVVLVAGFLYLLFIGRHLIPDRTAPGGELTKSFEMERFLTEVEVLANSPLVDLTVRDGLNEMNLDADVVQHVRDGKLTTAPLARKVIQPGDRLMIRTARNDLVRLLDTESLVLVPTAKLDAERPNPDATKDRLAEIVVLPDTNLIGETLRTLDFAERYEATILAIRHKRQVIHESLEDVELQGGDSILVLASDSRLQELRANPDFVVTEGKELARAKPVKIALSLGIVAGVVALAALEIMPILVSSLLGVILMIVTNCLKAPEVYQSVNWSVIFLLAGLIPLGTALEATGGAHYLAALVFQYAGDLSPIMMLLVFYLFTTFITQIISNNASVILMIPIAVSAAKLVGAEPFSFILAVTFAASTCMLSPVGYQTNLMVYGPGGYHFLDFFRVGAPLQIILAIVTTLGIWVFWGV